MRTVYLIIMLLLQQSVFSQSLQEKLTAAINDLEKDPQFSHAIIGMYVMDGTKAVYEKNAALGLAPASTQKVITAVSAFELLGASFNYKTIFSAGDMDANGYDIHIYGSGDPTFGSWRYAGTKEETVLKNLYQSLVAKKVQKINSFVVHTNGFNASIPGGWVWEDVANYYGAGNYQLNWRENQYDLIFNSGAPFTPARITGTKPALPYSFRNMTTAGAEGSGDNAYIYFIPGSDTLLVQGTIPPNKSSFTISGALYDPAAILVSQLKNYFKDINHTIPVKQAGLKEHKLPAAAAKDIKTRSYEMVYTHESPSLDSIIYWFLQKSINLYGEALVRSIGIEKGKTGEDGIDVIREFWNKNGIERSALKIRDGSGLSPAGRITAKALVQAMDYAKDKKWYPAFVNALPEMNGIKMKDGYMTGVRSYTGYVKSSSGHQYTFAFIVNNFDGSAATAREKMYRVLNLLK